MVRVIDTAFHDFVSSDPTEHLKQRGDSGSDVYGGGDDGDSNCSDCDPWEKVGRMTAQFFLGYGPEERSFTEDEIADAMKDAWRVNEARDYFYEQVRNGTKDLKDGVVNYSGEFGIEGLLRAGSDPVEQFVGSYRIDIDSSDGINLKFRLTNTTSMTSFLYGLGPNWSRDSFSPGGNMMQTYQWSEPIDFGRLP